MTDAPLGLPRPSADPVFTPDGSLHPVALPASVSEHLSGVEIWGRNYGAFDTNCFVLFNGDDTDDDGRHPGVIIDPGHGAATELKAFAESKSIRYEAVVLTHGHIDHYRDAGDFDLPVYVHPADRMFVELEPSQIPFGVHFDTATMTPPRDIRDLGDSITLCGVDFEIHHMPGHSPGHVMFRIPGFVIGGDVLFRGGIGRTDLPFSSGEDMLLSLKKIVSEFEDEDVVLTGHGQSTSVGLEKATNPFLRGV